MPDRSTGAHSFLVSRIIRETGEMSRVLFEILSLSRVFLSRVSSGGGREVPEEQGQLSRLSRVFSEIPILSRVMLSRVSSKGRGNYVC